MKLFGLIKTAEVPEQRTPGQKYHAVYDESGHVAIYMRAWADMLTEEGQQDIAPVQSVKTKAQALS